MQHAPPLDSLQRKLRSQICRRCYLRLPGSDRVGPDTPRPCERYCAIFTTLSQAWVIGEFTDPLVGSYEKGLRHLYHDVCRRPPSASTARCDTRALNKHQKRVLGVLTEAFSRAQ